MSVVILMAALMQGDKPFVYDAWEAWFAFPVGALVEHEIETGSGKTTMTRIIERKTADLVVIKVVRKVGGAETVDTEEVARPKPGDPPPTSVCKTCGKEHWRDVKEHTQKLTINKQELNCVHLEGTVVDCTGQKIGRLRRWYHKDVPGWLVKMETLSDDVRLTTLCVKYQKK